MNRTDYFIARGQDEVNWRRENKPAQTVGRSAVACEPTVTTGKHCESGNDVTKVKGLWIVTAVT